MTPIADPRPTEGLSGHAFTPIDLPSPMDRAVGFHGRLVGGLFGDPLFHLRHDQQPRGLLFDLGYSQGLGARQTHQITDVFVSHCHMDHFSGFTWLLRRRLGSTDTCRIYGPAGTAARVVAAVDSVLWDRIGDGGPVFQIADFLGDRLEWTELRVGHRPTPLRVDAVVDSVICRAPGFVVRSAVLDHGTPVLAFALQEFDRAAIRDDSLGRLGCRPGRWVGQLQERVLMGDRDHVLVLPDGRRATVGELARDLVTLRPGQKIAYAVDLADTSANRDALVALASDADLFLCEAGFSSEHGARARRTSHLTGRATGEIASAAGVARLLPFHLSNRYQWRPEQVFADVIAAFEGVWVPDFLRSRLTGGAGAAGEGGGSREKVPSG